MVAFTTGINGAEANQRIVYTIADRKGGRRLGSRDNGGQRRNTANHLVGVGCNATGNSRAYAEIIVVALVYSRLVQVGVIVWS